MNYTTTSDILYADACLIFMVTGVICAIVRWLHMCRPYDENCDYFYPARRQITFFFAAVVMQVPYFLCPSDESIWSYIRILGIIYYPICYAMLFLRYFHRQRLKGWKNWLFFSCPMLMLTAFMIFAATDRSGCFDRQFGWLRYVMGALSIVLSLRLLAVIRKMHDAIQDYHLQNYSAEEDFPYRFAEKVIWFPLIWILLEWAIFLSGSRELKAVIDILFSAWMVFFLCTILHPQRVQHPAGIEKKIMEIEKEEKALAQEYIDTVKQEEADATDTEREETASLPADIESDKVAQAVLAVILRRYKEQHLLKTEVLAEIDKGMIAPANRFIAQVGYYNLINMFRLRYAQLYIEAYPEAKLAEVALESGFLSGSAFSKAKKHVEHINPEYVANVRL